MKFASIPFYCSTFMVSVEKHNAFAIHEFQMLIIEALKNFFHQNKTTFPPVCKTYILISKFVIQFLRI